MSRLTQITEEQKERMLKYAAKAGGSGLPFIQYETDSTLYKMGNTDVTGMSFLAATDRCEAVWLYFPEEGGVEELVRTEAWNNDLPKRPMGYEKNSGKWWRKYKDKKTGEERLMDCLLFQYELPMIDDDGKVTVLKASRQLINAEVARLIIDLTETGRRPFITLTTVQDGNAKLPELLITGRSEDLEDIPLPGFDRVPSDAPPVSVSPNGKSAPTNGATHSSDTTTPKPARNSDMDDDIPF